MLQERLLYAQSLEAYIDLFESAPYIYLTVDPEGRLLDASHMGAKWLGIPRDEWLRRQVWAFFAPESRLTIQNALRQLHTGSASTTFTARSVSGDDVQVMSSTGRGNRPVLMAFMSITRAPES